MDTGQLTLPTVRARVMSSTNCIADRRVDGPLMPSAAGSRFRQRMKEQTEDNWTGCEQSAWHQLQQLQRRRRGFDT